MYFDVGPLGRHLGTGGKVSCWFYIYSELFHQLSTLSNSLCPQDGLVHIYDLQTGQWISGFQAASGLILCNSRVSGPLMGIVFCCF